MLRPTITAANYASQQGFDEGVQNFLSANQNLLAHHCTPMEMEAEPSERGWEMVSILRRTCRFPKELEMEVYAGIVGREAAISFLRWQSEQRARPLNAPEILDSWPEVVERAKAQQEDRHSVTMGSVIARLKADPQISPLQEQHLVSYLAVLPRDLRFAMVKALLTIPPVAHLLASDRHDTIILDAIRAISSEAS